MGVTLVERLTNFGDSPPADEYIRIIGGLDDNNLVKPASTDFDGALHVVPGAVSKDAFGRFRSSIPRGIFDSKQLYGKDSVLMVENLTGSATSTFNANHACVDLTLTTANGDKAIRQSRPYIAYQPGRGMLALISASFGSTPKVNVRQRMGLFDINDGVFFEQTSTGLRVVRRTSTSGAPVDEQVEQTDWNIDKLDGTGVSGFTLDVSKVNLYLIDFAWLGVGEVRIGVIARGHILYCHQFNVSNTLLVPWSKTPCLPIRYEIENTGVAATGTTMKQICCAAFSEGEYDPLGVVYAGDNGIVGRSASSGNPLPLVSVRLKSGTAFVRGLLYPTACEILTTSNANVHWQINIGGSITGGAWAALTQGSEINISGTAITGGIIIDSGYLGAVSRINTNIIQSLLSAAADFSGAPEALSLVVNPTAGNATCFGSIKFKEVI